LLKCIESIVAQTYSNLEIILVDDGSTDNSGHICDKYAIINNRINVIHTKKNTGPGNARNEGIKASHGDLIMFVDADDYIHTDAIRLMHDSICQDGMMLDMVMADYKRVWRIEEEACITSKMVVDVLTQNDLIKNMLKSKHDPNYHYVFNKLYRKEILTNIFFQDYPISEDYDFNFHVFQNITKAKWIHCELYYYRMISTSITNQKESSDIYTITILRILHDEISNLTTRERKYQWLLLKKMFRRLLYAKGKFYKSEIQELIYSECHKYEKATQKLYWRCWKINPIEKVVLILLLRNPKIVHWVLKRTRNL